MRKFISLMIIAMIAIGLTGCATSEPESDKLVIYTPAHEDKVNLTIPMFEEKTGISVELITASTGELHSRIKQEAENPMADVLWSGINEQIAEYFEPYVSENISNVPEEYQNPDERITGSALAGSVFVINTNLVDKNDVKGYKDLLNPKYKGMIAHGDVSASTSSFAHLKNILFGWNLDDPYDNNTWDFVKEFMESLDGKIVNSSGAIIQGVASGEYAIGLTFEEGGVQSVASGAPVEVVYPEEGVVVSVDQSAIIKNAKNMENAKKFIDFILSDEYQSAIGLETTQRPIDPDAKLAEYKVPFSEINWINDDLDWTEDNRDIVIEKYLDLWTDLE